MSYIVLARKWRPQSFDDLVGQETVVKTFKNALSSGKIVHAYLFSGPRGVGKTSSARILAKALNCLQRTDSDPCGKCESCKAITEGHSVDVFEIDGASNTGVDAVRELRETVKYAPSGGKYKIYIIDEVHMLSVPAFNALLKTLEEPPPHVVFIFATTEPKKIPATILSRCQHHSFRRVTKNRIKEQLKKITGAEQINIKEAALEMIAKAADGSMRDALTLLDQACSFSDDITEKELQTLLGLPDSEVISNLSEAILKGDASSSLSIIKEFTDRGSDLRQIAKELVEQFRNITIVKITQDAEDVFEFSREDAERLRGLAADVSIEELTLLLTELLRLEGEVRNAVNPRYTLELGLLRTSFVKGMTSIGDVMKMLDETPAQAYVRESSPQALKSQKDGNRGEKAPPLTKGDEWGFSEQQAAPQAEKKTEPVKQPDPDIITVIADKEELWQKLIEHLDSQDHLLACKLAEAKPVNMTTTELSIGFNGGMSVLADSIKKSAAVINPILQKLSGHSIKLKILSLPKKEIKNDVNKVKEKVFSEPIVQDAIRIFNGSMVKVKSLEEDKGVDNSD
ncbi:MAG: DNA polymerase III subunit gamma/tau [Nitrospirae bacterium]|nr:DNA polymerase III subunit gamma/tau [Nitrospirota bacterium]